MSARVQSFIVLQSAGNPYMASELLQSLLEEGENRPYTVTQINSTVRGELERRFSSVWIEGEITNFTAHGSGHWYFNLRDERSVLRAACFKGANSRIKFKPENGLQVKVRGKLTVYEPSGSYQIVVESLEPSGEGALRAAMEQIERKLRAEGLFDEDLKRPLPYLPHRVGVITSANGAAFHDIRKVILRRTSTVSILLIPAMVQGENAGADIKRAIEFANAYSREASPERKIDVLIVGRGGGSQEDLWAFNEEGLARAIRSSDIPIISAVGHEIDHTIADLVADVRAATPSNAAEIVSASEDSVRATLGHHARSIYQSVMARVLVEKNRVSRVAWAPALVGVPDAVAEKRACIESLKGDLDDVMISRLEELRRRVDDSTRRMSPEKLGYDVRQKRNGFEVLLQRQGAAMRKGMDRQREKLGIVAASLHALSPLKVLGRGYSLTRDGEGGIIRSAGQVSAGDAVTILVADGRIDAKVTATEKGNE